EVQRLHYRLFQSDSLRCSSVNWTTRQEDLRPHRIIFVTSTLFKLLTGQFESGRLKILSVYWYLFPDAAVEKSDCKNNTQLSNSSGTSEQEKTSDYKLFHQLKSAPSDSLTYRLALCVCLVNYYYGGLRAVGHLWQEFVLELRYRWENNHLICGLAGGAPDLRCCLLHQKFQMLNCCIERKKARDDSHKVPEGKEKEHRVSGACQKSRQGPECATSASSSTREMSQGKSWDSWSDSEEEFFKCLSDQGETEATQAEGRAEGRLHPYNNMTLLNSAEPLYVHSDSLAANPGCVLEDFVRWYSPRDYVEEEVVDEKVNTMVMGTLSPRMKIPGNMWVEAWETARVTPARRQKRLFDDTKEAEKVLHYMAMQKPADLARHLLPCILHATILKEEESAEDIPSVQKTIQQATVQASKLLQSPNQDYKKLEDFINQLLSMETVITQARSLKAKFSVPEDDSGEAADELKKFVSSLLEEPEVVVTGAGQGLAGSIIHGLFISAQRAALLAPVDKDLGSDKKQTGGSSRVPDFPPPAGREILLRTCVPRPAAYSKALPQRLFCVLMREEFRLTGAFSTDTSFF
ncbi:rab3 GTPase-activating protein catalytic subunit-like, partial [Maylandia zebra]|uniref:rab3 GTPase-activating protein catalytic subunit-like n=1 Tax=Maylandia zebra TaxID=106582 RepID=UPI00403D09F9